MIEMEKESNPKFTPPAHWLEGEDEEEAEEDETESETENSVETELRNQVSILRSHCAETKLALVSWNGQTKQMFFRPENALEDLSAQIKRQWAIPRKVYWLQVNGIHESQISDWPAESSVVVKVRGFGAGPMATVKIHLKTPKAKKIFEVSIKEDAKLEDVEALAEDLFDETDEVKLYQDGAELSLEDGVKEWMTSTGGNAKLESG
jgi:hypothetical protein